jgi:sugar transferase (PEP-CTERM system associated)
MVLLGFSETILVGIGFIGVMLAFLGPLNTSILLNYERGGVKLAVILGVFAICMYYFDLYDSMVLSSQRESFTRLVQALGSMCLILAVVYFLFPVVRFTEQIYIAGTLAVVTILLVWRRLFMTINAMPAFLERTLLLGDGALANALLNEIETRPELGLKVVSHLTEDHEWARSADFRQDRFGREVERIVAVQGVRHIVVAMGERRGRMPVEKLLELKKQGIRIQDGVELYEFVTGKVALHALRPSWLLFGHGFQVARWYLLYKRMTSFLLASVLLVAMLPVMAVIALLVHISSPGPVIFRQRRVGKNGKAFVLYKFRSMYCDTEEDDRCVPVAENDERVTHVGRWIRASRLDELPQLWNIVRGDMHFVGPRPFVPDQEKECLQHIPFYSQRWSVMPGATGWAQVNRAYCANLDDNADKLAYDLFYIKNISIGLDLLILFKTAKILLLGRGAR